MKKMCLGLCLLMIISGCQKQSQNDLSDTYQEDYSHETTNKQNKGDNDMQQLTLTIHHQDFSVTLEDNATVTEFMKYLPMTITMDELHGNEKYYYMNQKLPTNAQSVDFIEAGDLMLFGDNCLVLFYKSFQTSYTYTRLGHVDDVKGFIKQIDSNSLQVNIYQ